MQYQCEGRRREKIKGGKPGRYIKRVKKKQRKKNIKKKG